MMKVINQIIKKQSPLELSVTQAELVVNLVMLNSFNSNISDYIEFMHMHAVAT